jgi:uncharacterized protein
MKNQFVWVDIPVLDLDRAIKFYSAVLGAEVALQSFSGDSFGLLPHAQTNVSGCLYQSEDNRPSQTGPLIYLNADGRIDGAISAVLENGGKIIQEKHQIGEHGYRAVILDSEGNKIALHSSTA